MTSQTVYKEFKSSLKVWNYFLKAEGGLTAKCKLCKKILQTKDRSPKGLHVHLKSIHHIIDSQNTVTSQEDPAVDIGLRSDNSAPSTSAARNTESSPPSGSTAPKIQKITDHFQPTVDKSVDRKVSKMVAKSGYPFRVFCTCEETRELFTNSGYKLPKSPNSIKAMVMKYGETLKMKITRELQQLKGCNHRFTLTFDEWTSSMNKRYMNVNVHTFSKNHAVFWNLGLIRVFGSMPAESCIQLLKEKLSQYDLSLDKDVVNITTDGASLMVKVGRLIHPLQQLCYAHGIQLAIIDVIYKKQAPSEEELVNVVTPDDDDDSEDSQLSPDSDADDEMGVRYSFPAVTVELNLQYTEIISKLRRLVVLFKKSPTKNDLLQTYIKKEFGRTIHLVLDCKTRWSSLAEMIETFNKLKSCVGKTLIDLKLGASPEYFLTENETMVLTQLEQVFKPIKLAVEVLCRRDSTLLDAETTLRFVVRKLNEIGTPLAQKMVDSLKKRISERRTNCTAALLYLKDPFKYEEDREMLEAQHDETFELPPKSIVRKETIKLVERLHPNPTSSESQHANIDDDDDDMALSDLQASRSRQHISINEELEETLKAFKMQKSSSASQTIGTLLKKELNLFESGGTKGNLLNFANQCFLTIVPTSVESERAFSAAGYLACKIRSRMSDESLNMLCFMRSYFTNEEN